MLLDVITTDDALNGRLLEIVEFPDLVFEHVKFCIEHNDAIL